LAVYKCKKYGHGVQVTGTGITRGDVVTQYYGELISKAGREGVSVETHLFSWGKGQGCDIDGIKDPVPGYPAGSFINHSTTPNCELVRDPSGSNLFGVFAIALEDISVGSWLSVDYGRSFLSSARSNLSAPSCSQLVGDSQVIVSAPHVEPCSRWVGATPCIVQDLVARLSAVRERDISQYIKVAEQALTDAGYKFWALG
jgi:hypothetical protein